MSDEQWDRVCLVLDEWRESSDVRSAIRSVGQRHGHEEALVYRWCSLAIADDLKDLAQRGLSRSLLPLQGRALAPDWLEEFAKRLEPAQYEVGRILGLATIIARAVSSLPNTGLIAQEKRPTMREAAEILFDPEMGSRDDYKQRYRKVRTLAALRS